MKSLGVAIACELERTSEFFRGASPTIGRLAGKKAQRGAVSFWHFTGLLGPFWRKSPPLSGAFGGRLPWSKLAAADHRTVGSIG